MTGFIVSIIVGAICIGLGISNMRGNISSLHSYHRSKISEEDRIPFGKRVGLGTIIIGIGIIIFSACGIAAFYTENNLFTVIGTVIMIVSIVVGMIISFAAMKKYNGSIF